MQAAPTTFVPQFLFAGIFLRIEQIPVWIRWAQYLCSLKFGMDLYLINEFGSSSCDSSRAQDCTHILDVNDADERIWWAYMLILLGIFFLIRILGLVVLTRKARGFALA